MSKRNQLLWLESDHRSIATASPSKPSKFNRPAARLGFWTILAGKLLALLLLGVPRTSCGDDLFVGDVGNHSIWKFGSSGTGTIFAGLNDPFGLAFDSKSNLYACTFESNVIWKFDSYWRRHGLCLRTGPCASHRH